MERYCSELIYKDLRKKIVFLGGPREVGKTTLSKKICQKYFPGRVPELGQRLGSKGYFATAMAYTNCKK